MEWWKDSYSIKLRIQTFFSMLLQWTFVILLLLITGFAYKNYPNHPFISIIIIPLLLSIFVSYLFKQAEIFVKKVIWAEQEIHIYRDLLEIFSVIIRQLGESANIDPQRVEPEATGYSELDRIENDCDIIKSRFKDKTLSLDINKINVERMGFKELVDNYYLIIIRYCTEDTFVFFYSILITNILKFQKDLNILKNGDEMIFDYVRKNLNMQAHNIADEIKVLYKIAYKKVDGEVKDENKFSVQHYFEKMFGGQMTEIDKQKNALDKAWEIRNFEIDKYWQRTAYFWAFIVSIATAYFCTLNLSQKDFFGDFSKIVLLLLSLLGIAFSLIWVLSNKASKYWQENWERHINFLETKYYGNLYKTILSNPKLFLRPSISRLNFKASELIFAVWTILYFACPDEFYPEWFEIWYKIFIYIAILIVVMAQEIKWVQNILAKFFKPSNDIMMKNKSTEEVCIINDESH